MRETLHARYLPAETFDQILKFVKKQPVLAGVLFVVIYVLILAILRKSFGRLGYELLMLSIVLCAIAIFLSSAGYTYFKIPGFQFGF